MLAQKTFTSSGQEDFGALSGDRNPMHLDPIAARRTQAGAPVVHGIHLLLWALDAFARTSPDAQLRKLRVRFVKFVYVGETADLTISAQSARSAKLAVAVEGTVAAQITIDFGEPAAMPMPIAAPTSTQLPAVPLDIAFERLQELRGRLPYATPASDLATAFPAAARWIGGQRLAALAASTNLVGMICPGLHSIYSSLTVETCADASPSDALDYEVSTTDPRFRMVKMTITGGGVTGSIDAFSRVPPVTQPTVQSLATEVAPDRFAGSHVLIVGGSRGIGELTAKLIAAGGGRTTITYASGKNDAERVASEIGAAGAVCEAIPYDARQPAAPQLGGLKVAPTHLYYFATPVIFGRQSEIFSPRRFEEFLRFYVHGFLEVVNTLRARQPALSVFYPSSVAVEERPRGMTEYAMAKVAGEVLCADLNESLAPLRITTARLPRMETDQTATFMPVESRSALEVMRPLILAVQARDGAN